MEVIKEFVVKSYVDATFDTNLDDSESRPGYILSIKIYRDRSRRLIIFSMSTYLDKILKEFKMDLSKKKF